MENSNDSMIQFIPAIDLRQIFLTMATTLSIIGFMLNAILIYLIIFKTPKNMVEYKIILIQNFFADLFFNTLNDLCKAQNDYKFGCFFVVGSDFLKSLPILYSFILIALWIFALFYCVTSMTVQFVYRYFIIVKEKPLTNFKYFLLILIAIGSALSLGILSGYVMKPQENILKEKSLLLKNDKYYFREIPFFLVAEIQYWPLRIHFGLCYLVVMLSYGILGYCGYKVWKKLNSQKLTFSSQTRKMQNQMTKTMILQATVPLVFSGIPIAIAMLAVYTYADIPGLGMILNSICCWIPIANSLVTIISIKAYQNAVIRCFCYFFRKCPKGIIIPPTISSTSHIQLFK